MPPEPSQRFHGKDKRLGAPIADYAYHNAAGQDVLHVCRYRPFNDGDAPPVEDVITLYWTWTDSTWVARRGAPERSPLFQLDRLNEHYASPAYVTDTEESAAALQMLFDEHEYRAIATTFPGGLGRATRDDLLLLMERPVTFWISHRVDRARDGAMKAASLLWRGENREVGFIHTPTDKPAGWGASTAVETGWSWADIRDFMKDHRRGLEAVPRDVPEAAAPNPGVDVEIMHEPREAPIGGSLMEKWRTAALSCNANGAPYNNMFNASRIIEVSKGAYCDVWLDEFRDKIMTRGSAEEEAREWREVDTFELTRFIQSPQGYGIQKMSPTMVHEAVVLQASKQKRNEVRDWLQSLKWDGKNRLNESFIRGWGVNDTAYYRAIGRCFIMGAAARILLPGCKVDTLPVFEGAQGIFKSTSLLTLASERWYDEPSYDVGSIDFLQSLKGKWILEFAEMAVLSGRQGDKNNSVITRRVDTYRPSYGRIAVSYPRMCVFAATTNNPEWNDSEFGARRFWPVRCGRIDLGYIAELREQLFAEAVARVERGEQWFDVPLDEAKSEQEARIPVDAWDKLIKDYLQFRQECEIGEILLGALDIKDTAKWSGALARRVGVILRRNGWLSVRTAQRRFWRNSQKVQPPPVDEKPPGF